LSLSQSSHGLSRQHQNSRRRRGHRLGGAEHATSGESDEHKVLKLVTPAYDVLSAGELDEMVAGLEPIAAAVQAVDD
jgi:hypothetical protein